MHKHFREQMKQSTISSEVKSCKVGNVCKWMEMQCLMAERNCMIYPLCYVMTALHIRNSKYKQFVTVASIYK